MKNKFLSAVEMSSDSRRIILELCHKYKTSHIGSAFSCVEILIYLYKYFLNVTNENINDPTRDYFFMSKGHAATSLYSTLSLFNIISKDELLNNFTADGSYFTSHINSNINGIELSTGSLGNALGVAGGLAYAKKIKKEANKIVVLLSDGELDEGSNWEALLFISHHNLNNLITVIDYNKIQSFGATNDVLNLDSLGEKLKSFNFNIIEVDGHSFDQLDMAFNSIKINNPTVIIANTIKGKGVPFFENKLLWHYKSPNSEEYQSALSFLENQ